jgi:hypothetical protein
VLLINIFVVGSLIMIIIPLAAAVVWIIEEENDRGPDD